MTGATVNGATLVLTYDLPLDPDSVPVAAAFTVEVDGTARALASPGPGTVPVAVDEHLGTVTLTLATAVTQGERVTLDYTVPTGAGAMPIRTATGNNETAGALTRRGR